MDKLITKLFQITKSFFQFCKIIVWAFITIHILYWMQNLMGAHWSWMDIFRPVLDLFLDFANLFSDGSVNLFAAVFEFKYGIAVILYILIYYLACLGITVTNIFEDKYKDICHAVNRAQENKMNLQFEDVQRKEQSQIHNYSIYVTASLKKSIYNKDLDLNENINNMNTFLIKNTSVVPEKYENGFLYSFNNFENIDRVLEVFFKLINSKVPMDYVICVQVDNINKPEINLKMKRLIKLNFANKITALADTVWRYKYNKIRQYSISKLGIYQGEESNYEAYHFVDDKNL